MNAASLPDLVGTQSPVPDEPSAPTFLITYFPDVSTPVGTRQGPTTLPKFIASLSKPKPSSVPKEALGLFSPGTYRENKRNGSNVEGMWMVGFDVDVTPIPSEADIRAACKDFACIAHTTSSSTVDAPKWRLFVPLSRCVTADEYRTLHAALRASFGFPVGDAAIDAARQWYLPRDGEDGTPCRFFETTGEAPILDSGTWLARAPAVVATPSGPRLATTNVVFAEVLDPKYDAAVRTIGDAVRLACPADVDEVRRNFSAFFAGALLSECLQLNTDAPRPEELRAFCNRVFEHAGFQKRENKLIYVTDTVKRKATGEQVTGYPTLREKFPLVAEAINIAFPCTLSGVFIDEDCPSPPLSGDAAQPAGASSEALATRPIALATTPANDALSTFDFDWGGFDRPLPPVEYTVADFLVKGSVSMLVAPGSSLKSWVAFSLARAVALGQPWLGKFEVEGGRAAVLDFESGKYEVRRRMKLLGGAGLERLGASSYPELRLTEPRAWDKLAKLGLTLLVIDSLHACAPDLDENDTRIAVPLQLASKFSEATGCTVVFIHHANKGERKDKREKVRGSSALFGACDSIYGFEKLDAPHGVSRARMEVWKPGAGQPPKPISLELSDAVGLRFYEDAGATLASKAREPEDLVAAVRRSLTTSGPASGVKDLALRLGKREARVKDAVAVLDERGEILKLPREIRIDGAAARKARVIKVITDLATEGDRVTSARELARRADVAPKDIDTLTRGGVIAKVPGFVGSNGSSYVVRETE